MEEATVKVLVVDDHQMMIDGVKAMLRKEKNIAVAAEATSGQTALEILRSGNEIDVIITDINMEPMSGTELTTIVKKEFPDVKVLVLSMYHDPAIVHTIIMAEAEGYILKNSGKDELIKALCRIADNGTYYSNEVVSDMMREVKQKTVIGSNLKNLSPREIEIIKLIVEENTTNQIAEKLFISPRTVDTHRKNILQKINTKTIVGLIKFAYENKLAE